MIKIIYAAILTLLFLPNSSEAQTNSQKKTVIQKNMEVTEENGIKTVTITTTENGKTTQEVYTGEEAEKYLQDQHHSNGTMINDEHHIFMFSTDSMMKCKMKIHDDLKGNFDHSFHFDFDSLIQISAKDIMGDFDWNGDYSEEMKKMMEEMQKNLGEMKMEFHDTIIKLDGNEKNIMMIMHDGDENEIIHTSPDGKVIRIEKKEPGDENGEKKATSIKKVMIARFIMIEDIPAEKKKNELEDVKMGFYPNPGNGDFTLEFTIEDNDETVITIHDLTGKTIYTETVKGKGDYKKQIHLDEPSGIYIVKIQQGKKSMTKKLIIQ